MSVLPFDLIFLEIYIDGNVQYELLQLQELFNSKIEQLHVFEAV